MERKRLPLQLYMVTAFTIVAYITIIVHLYLDSDFFSGFLSKILLMTLTILVSSFILSFPMIHLIRILITKADQIALAIDSPPVNLPKYGIPKEIAMLAESFNKMAVNISTSSQIQKDINEHLEGEFVLRSAELLRRNRELSILYTLSNELEGSRSLDLVLNTTVETARKMFDVDLGAVIRIVKGDAECVVWSRSEYLKLTPKPSPSQLRDGFSYSVINTGKVEIINDLEPYFDKMEGEIGRSKMRSLLVVPIRSRHQILGSLTMASRHPNRFQTEDIDFLKSFGSQVGMAIENAMLFEQLQKEYNRFISIVESMKEALIIINDGTITYCNSTFEKFFGIEFGDFYDKQISHICEDFFVNSDDKKEIFTYFMKISQGSISTAYYETVIKQPILKHVGIQSFPVYCEQAQCLGYGFLIRDISREKEIDNIKSTLISTVSHEIRTPLTSIKGYATSLLRKDVTWDVDTQKDFLLCISDECDQLEKLVDNILDISRIEAGIINLSYEEVNLQALIEKSIGLGKKRYPERVFNCEAKGSLPNIRIDQTRIQQLIFNLLDNAVKYSSKDSIVSVWAQSLPGEVIISVSDQGIGIPSDHIPYIFERFHRVGGNHPARGVGLGLGICKGIVAAHHGKLWLETIIGEGSTFHFSLPLTRKSEEKYV